eukprot:TRINITY_DN8222_c2_g1_i1.p1 TRINITY_DN8222_c2_g1~~TRINITY_DN8222_c2_g1_i1.p1  ORF type:complete len:317 (-),score=56.35 TRINITY_DN8222_c2_g1_i1:335-1285(-)
MTRKSGALVELKTSEASAVVALGHGGRRAATEARRLQVHTGISVLAAGSTIVRQPRPPRSRSTVAAQITSKDEALQRCLSGSERPCKTLRWPGLPSASEIAFSTEAIGVSLPLSVSPQDFCSEADALRLGWPESTWQREGKPDKMCLGPRTCAEDWAKYRSACPRILEVAERLLHSLSDQQVEVSFGDVLDYRGQQLLGWHQDNMDLSRHTFTVVLTLAAEGHGCFEWREIAADSKSLAEITASATPSYGDLAIHGLTCNNGRAHRAFWDTGRRVALVLFCRSEEMEKILKESGVESCISMRHWWSKDFETIKSAV